MKYSSEEYDKVINRSFEHFEGFFTDVVLDEDFLKDFDNESKEQLLKDIQDKWGNDNYNTLEDLVEAHPWTSPMIFLVNNQTNVCYIITIVDEYMDYPDSIILPVENYIYSVNKALKVIHGLDKKQEIFEEKKFL